MRLRHVYAPAQGRKWRLYARAAHQSRSNLPGASHVADFLIVVFGTGGILLMAGYAALCERI